VTNQKDETSQKHERQLVVVGVDGSEQSVAALRWAARYAAAAGAAVRAVLVWHYPMMASTPESETPDVFNEDSKELMQSSIDAAIDRAFPGQPDPGIATQVSYGHPAEVLIEESKHADLLVVGGSGHGAFTGMLVGSVSIHCVTGAFCPVTVIRGQ
jgi:nucleotide-binding universal stress UspA family protein